MAVDVKIDFKPASASTQSGYLADSGATYASRNGYAYGWDKANTNAADRNSSASPNQAYDTFIAMRDSAGSNRTWNIALPSGSYKVRLVSGDATNTMSPVVKIEGSTFLSGSTTSSKRFIDVTKTIRVTDGKLTLTNGSSTSKSAINFIQITSADSDGGPDDDNGTDDGGTTTNGGWPSTSSWKAAASSPIARFEAHSFSYNGKLYVMGGFKDSSFNSTTRVDVYDPATNKWSQRSSMKAPETHAGTALDASKGVIYFVGGHRGKYPSKATDEVWKYTIASDSWTKLSVKLPYKMGANTCQIVNGKLYSFGGNYADRSTNTSDVFVLDLSNISAGFKKQPHKMPNARDHASSVVIGGKIYVFGGELGHDKKHDQQRMLQSYDPATDTWKTLANMPGEKSHAESSNFVWNGQIYLAGGQTNPQAPTKTVWRYNPSTNKWSTLSSLPASRQGTTVLKVGNYLVFTVGGINTSQPQKTTWVYKLA